ncbi:hypothetical protein [uncultured Flavobacterium sp.]|jgi:CheY-like chemotaxis protein|uniref:hypothetical protein n=1 Tax=uncultured Flavobacterium sp. TaxID=165435 RepID=UPI0030C86AEA
MHNIGIIDDNKDQRETLRLALGVYLEQRDSSLGVIDIYPFETDDFSEYFSWIDENKIVCLIFDERMHNDSENEKGPVGYRGNELVVHVRNRYKDIPIYVITSHKEDEDLQIKFSQFEDIIDRQQFTNEGEKYVDRFIRATQRYLDENILELEEYQKLAESIAIGNCSEDDQIKFNALRVKLNLPVDINLGDRKDWLNQYEENINELLAFKNNLEEKLKKN